MRLNPTLTAFCLMIICSALGVATTHAGERKFEAQLIWATNEKQSPNTNHIVVESEIRERLNKLPLKWENYFEVNRQQLCLDKGGTNRVVLSHKCTVEVNMKDAKKVEVLLIGKNGKVITSQAQPLEKGNIVVLGGEAPNSTAWLVTVKRTQ
jgi:hypothetical protein